MTNEYGAPLDRNGYAPSLLQTDLTVCYTCGRNGYADKLDRHEIFYGPFRQKSKRHGLWVMLCHDRCHEYGPLAVHNNSDKDEILKIKGENAAMQTYHWTTADFRREFGKNYL